MSYYWYHDHTDIYMAAEHQAAALKRFKELVGRAHWRHDERRMSVQVSRVLEAEMLEEAIKAWGWMPTWSETGSLLDIKPEVGTGNEFKNRHEVVLFQALAPFIPAREGDPDGDMPFHVELHNSEGSIWRWAFKGGKVYEVNAELIFPMAGVEEAKDE